jgi:hypothetical protein
MGAIEGRHAKAKKPSPAKNTARRTPIKTRRVFGLFLVPEVLSELDFISFHFTVSVIFLESA